MRSSSRTDAKTKVANSPIANEARNPMIFDDGGTASDAAHASHAGDLRFDLRAAEKAWNSAKRAVSRDASRAQAASRTGSVHEIGDEGTAVIAGTLKLAAERRKVPRREVKGGAMAVFSTGRGAGTLARVDLLDASWTGLGVASPIEVEPGTSVSVIPEHAMSPRQVGIVVRCEAFNDGYRLGLQCRTQKAVA